MTPLELVVDNSSEVKAEALTWPERAKALKILDHDKYCDAAEMLKNIKALRVRIAETFDPHVKRAHDAHKALVKEKADAEAPLTEAERVLKTAIVAYDQEQERLRREEERRLQEIARKDEETRRLNEAAAMEAEGNRTEDPELLYEANKLIETPAPTPVVTVARTTPKVSGVTMRETWSGRVTDKTRLIRFVAEHPEYANLIEPNMAAVNALARSLKGALKVDGVQAFATQSVAAGSR
jgi:hypothetical protein